MSKLAINIIGQYDATTETYYLFFFFLSVHRVESSLIKQGTNIIVNVRKNDIVFLSRKKNIVLHRKLLYRIFRYRPKLIMDKKHFVSYNSIILLYNHSFGS